MTWLINLLKRLIGGWQNPTPTPAPAPQPVPNPVPYTPDDDQDFPVVDDESKKNKPDFDPMNWPPNWSTKSERKYTGELSKPGEFRGVVRCGSVDDAMGKRYLLRSHFEWDLGRQYGAKPLQVTIVIHNKDKSCIAWAVSTEDPQSLPLPK